MEIITKYQGAQIKCYLILDSLELILLHSLVEICPCHVGGLNILEITCRKDFDDQVNKKLSKLKSRIGELRNCVSLIIGVYLHL